MRRLCMFIATAIGALVFAGAAPASVFTSPGGTAYTGEIKAESEAGHFLLESEGAPKFFRIECQAAFAFSVEKHGSGITPGGALSSLLFNNCTNGDTVIVNKAGSLEAHAVGSGNGTLTASGAEITVHVLAQGIKCVYETINTHIGTLTGGTPATIDVLKATLNRTGGSAFCGTGGLLVAAFKVTTPATLLVS